MKRSLVLLFIISVLLTSCSIFQSRSDEMSEILPRESDLPGWEAIDSPVYYRGGEIVNYNRDYKRFGVKGLVSISFRSIENDDLTVRYEILKFSSVIDAYGCYSVTRGPGIYEASEINEYSDNSMSLVQAGEYLFYSHTDRNDMLLKKDLKTFTNISLKNLAGNYKHEALPGLVNILKGTEGYGILYSRRPYHRLPLVGRIFFTQWIWDNMIVEIFLSECPSHYEAGEIFRKVTKNEYILLSSRDVFTAFRKEGDGTYSFISVYGKWIYGCWSVTDLNQGKNILKEINTRLEAAGRG